MPQSAPEPWTIERFFAWHARQPHRYDLVDGLPARMMAGAGNAHDAVVVTLLAELRKPAARPPMPRVLRRRQRADPGPPDPAPRCRRRLRPARPGWLSGRGARPGRRTAAADGAGSTPTSSFRRARPWSGRTSSGNGRGRLLAAPPHPHRDTPHDPAPHPRPRHSRRRRPCGADASGRGGPDAVHGARAADHRLHPRRGRRRTGALGARDRRRDPRSVPTIAVSEAEFDAAEASVPPELRAKRSNTRSARSAACMRIRSPARCGCTRSAPVPLPANVPCRSTPSPATCRVARGRSRAWR